VYVKEVMSTIGIGEKKVVIISVYNRGSWKNLEEKLNRILKDMKNEDIGKDISKDFNVENR